MIKLFAIPQTSLYEIVKPGQSGLMLTKEEILFLKDELNNYDFEGKNDLEV